MVTCESLRWPRRPRRHNFQRIYDLRERVVPWWNDAEAPPLDDVKRALTLKAVRALGIAQPRWVPDYFRTRDKGNAALLEHLVGDGALLRVEVEGWTVPGYVHADHTPLLSYAAAGSLEPALTTLLSPFDPLVWDRARCKTMFDFDYRIECYTPEARRLYGYFTLPILRRGHLIGRLDAKAHRKEGLFEVKVLHLEPGIKLDGGLIEDVAGALLACAGWHAPPGTRPLRLSCANPTRPTWPPLWRTPLKVASVIMHQWAFPGRQAHNMRAFYSSLSCGFQIISQR